MIEHSAVPDSTLDRLRSFFRLPEREPTDAELIDLGLMTLYHTVLQSIAEGPTPGNPTPWQLAILSLGKLGREDLAEELELGAASQRGEA